MARRWLGQGGLTAGSVRAHDGTEAAWNGGAVGFWLVGWWFGKWEKLPFGELGHGEAGSLVNLITAEFAEVRRGFRNSWVGSYSASPLPFSLA